MLTLDFLTHIPKVELHAHITGSMSMETVTALYSKNVPGPPKGLEECREMLSFSDFHSFLRTWAWKNESLIKDYEDFVTIAEGVARHRRDLNIKYSELFFSPCSFRRRGFSPAIILEALCEGISRVPEVEIALIADLVRNYGPDEATLTLKSLLASQQNSLIGIGIGGNEAHYPAKDFAEVFAYARALGLQVTAHAGEAAGAESVRDAVEILQVSRIGHGTRAIEDESVLDLLYSRDIGIELCPNSNHLLGVISRLSDHPLPRFMQRGIKVSINTDDPCFFGLTLVEELALIIEEFNLTSEDLQQIFHSTIAMSWAPPAKKESLMSQIDEYFALHRG